MKGKKIFAVVLMLILCFSFSANAFANGTIVAGRYSRVYTNTATKKVYLRCHVSANVRWDIRMLDKKGKVLWEEKDSCHHRTSTESIRDYSVGTNVRYIEMKLVPNAWNSTMSFPVTVGGISKITWG